jgi:hypothetical protein
LAYPAQVPRQRFFEGGRFAENRKIPPRLPLTTHKQDIFSRIKNNNKQRKPEGISSDVLSFCVQSISPEGAYLLSMMAVKHMSLEKLISAPSGKPKIDLLRKPLCSL